MKGRHAGLMDARRLATQLFRDVDGPSDDESVEDLPTENDSTESSLDLFDEMQWGIEDLVEPHSINAEATISHAALNIFRESRDLAPVASVTEVIDLARTGMENEGKFSSTLTAVQADFSRSKENLGRSLSVVQ